MKGKHMQGNISRQMQLPLERYRQMRESNPVYFDSRFNSWNVFRYDDALRVLTDHVTFSSEQYEQIRQPSLLSMDPPRHRQLRNIVSQAFTPRVIAQLAPKITRVTNELLDQVIPNGEMDVIRDLAYPLPITIIAELLGVPVEDRATFRQWSEGLVTGFRVSDRETQRQVRQKYQQELEAYFAQKLEERRRQPQQDLMSRLIAAEVDGQHLGEAELLEFCRLLLIAGHETTANLIGNAVVCFDEHPEIAEQLRSDPSLMPGAIEEILRCFTSVAGASRVTTTDTVLAGQQIGKNQLVLVSIVSANYDETQFPDPERIDIRREPNRHLAFGYGIHFCLGAPLARLEAKIALNLFLERLSEVQRVPNIPVEPVVSPFILGVKRFPITFKRASTH